MVTRISSILFACALAIALLAPVASAEDNIALSRHNFSVTGQWNTVTETNRICVFCHTPHGGVAMAAVPLWNKNIDTTQMYMQHEMPEVQGTVGNRGVGSVSLLCLQCHDGTQAIDTMLNAPGSGWGAGDGITAASQGWTFLEFNKYSGGDTTGCGTCEASYIGTNLMNDHPISIGFAEGTCNANDCSSVDEHYNTPTNGTAGDDTLSFANTIKVILRDAADFGYTTIDPYTVECSSCHNPHLGSWDAGSTATGATEMFLRVADNDNSGVCLTCHIK